jgi:regulation of enolase protein 1 (concanavalin A-like superfamily)
MDLSKFHWIYPPKRFELTKDLLTIHTDPDTDYWQRTYYGFRHDNAPAFLLPVHDKEFSFTVKTRWNPVKLFDQCGVVLYADADNWFKASVEYESNELSKLGSVVTNLGYSDWATTDIRSSQNEMFYRLSRRGQDFCIENSQEGKTFKQMRIFHMHLLMASVNIGVYACSPLECSMQATFSEFELGKCQWPLYGDQE